MYMYLPIDFLLMVEPRSLLIYYQRESDAQCIHDETPVWRDLI